MLARVELTGLGYAVVANDEVRGSWLEVELLRGRKEQSKKALVGGQCGALNKIASTGTISVAVQYEDSYRHPYFAQALSELFYHQKVLGDARIVTGLIRRLTCTM